MPKSTPQCYRCNRTGSCRGCACSKVGERCFNCLPNKLGSCVDVLKLTRSTEVPVMPQLANSAIQPSALGQKPSSDVTTLACEDINPLPFPEQVSTANFQWGWSFATGEEKSAVRTTFLNATALFQSSTGFSSQFTKPSSLSEAVNAVVHCII